MFFSYKKRTKRILNISKGRAPGVVLSPVYETSSGYTDVTTDTNYYILTVDVALDNATNPTKLVATCSKITLLPV